MLLNRDEIREDKYFGMLTEAILEAISRVRPTCSFG